MTKIVYNTSIFEFHLSQKAIDLYWELKGEPMPADWRERDVDRVDPILVQVVEELGKEANTRYTNLHIRELPAGTLYRIDRIDDDGSETVMTQDEYEWSVA